MNIQTYFVSPNLLVERQKSCNVFDGSFALAFALALESSFLLRRPVYCVNKYLKRPLIICSYEIYLKRLWADFENRSNIFSCSNYFKVINHL